jgi:hypothetical protein
MTRKKRQPAEQAAAEQGAAEQGAAEQVVRWLGIVNSPDGLNLRRTPDTLNPPLAVLSHETPLQVLDDSGDWLRVIANGQEGYVYAAHVLRRLDPQPLEPDPDRGTNPEDAFAAPGDQQISLGANASFLERLLARVWNRYGAALIAEAQRLQVDPTFAAALLALESGGNGFDPGGRMVIRFENHIFYHYWGQHNQAQFFAHFAFDSGATWKGHRWRPDPNGPWQECHLDDQNVEWQVFNFARQLDETAAILSISMGLAQIMGFNHQAVGFANVQSMFQALSSSIAEQITAFFRFVESKRAVGAMRAEDYPAFARDYNGGGQVDAYAAKLRDYVGTLRALRQPVAVSAAAAPEPGPAAAPTTAPWSIPEPTPAEAEEAAAHYRRWWLSVGAAALALLAVIAVAFHQGGWRLVRKEELTAD